MIKRQVQSNVPKLKLWYAMSITGDAPVLLTGRWHVRYV